MSNYSAGFADGVSIQGMPILNTYSENVKWVDSNNGSNGNDGSFGKPWATVAYAVTHVGFTASRGGVVMVKAGHAETVSAAGTITMSKAGISVVGLGVGDNRPNFTFSATASTWLMTAANCSVNNVVMTCGIDSVVSAMVVSAAGCSIMNVEFIDTTDIEFVTAILTTTSANVLNVKIKYRGFATGNAHVATVQLVGCDTGDIDVDFYGVASTAVVNFITTACTNIKVTGNFRNIGVTDGSKNVVDTQGSSTWWAEITDVLVGTTLKFGSSFPVAAVIGAQSDASRIAIKNFAATGTSLTTGNSPVSAFTVTGHVMMRVWGVTGGTALASTLNNGTLAVGISGSTTIYLGSTTMDGTNFTAGAVWIDTSATLKSEAFVAANLVWHAVSSTTVIVTVATNSSTSGVLTLYCEWKPVSVGATVVAA
jgi:hypothetical protein